MNLDFYIIRIADVIYIAHKLPGEVRFIARIEHVSLDNEQQERYANMIVDALNKEAK